LGVAFYLARCYLLRVDTLLKFRGREVRPDDIAFLRDLIAASPKASRRALSFKVCEAWAWAQPNGAPCDALCRGLMLKLHRAGHLVLPPPVWTSRQPRRHEVVTKIDVLPAPLAAPLADIGPLDIRQVRRTPDEDLVKSLVQEHHYLGYVHPVGEHLKYLVGEVTNTLGRPPKRRLRIAARHRLDEPLEIRQQRRILVYELLPPSPGATTAVQREGRRARLLNPAQFGLPDADRARGDTDCAGDNRHASPPDRQCLRRCEQTPSSFVQRTSHALEPFLDSTPQTRNP
jgi:hypothetical protein